jgi:hypothetical protein
MTMTRAWLYADDIIATIDEMVKNLREKAFLHKGRTHLYSGPSPAVQKQILGKNFDNQYRAQQWAKNHSAVMIDDTPIGQFLINFEGTGTFGYFMNHPHVPAEDYYVEGIKPWKHASRLFVASLWGDVTTTICGADRRGVYHTIELSTALNPNHMGLSVLETLQLLLNPKNRKIKRINEIDKKIYDGLYFETDYERAARLVALGEQRMALHEALKNASPANVRDALRIASKEVLQSPAEAYEYFLESQRRYRIDRSLQSAGTPIALRPAYNQTPEMRWQLREKKLQDFVNYVLAAIDNEITLMPTSVRPAFTPMEATFEDHTAA